MLRPIIVMLGVRDALGEAFRPRPLPARPVVSARAVRGRVYGFLATLPPSEPELLDARVHPWLPVAQQEALQALWTPLGLRIFEALPDETLGRLSPERTRRLASWTYLGRAGRAQAALPGALAFASITALGVKPRWLPQNLTAMADKTIVSEALGPWGLKLALGGMSDIGLLWIALAVTHVRAHGRLTWPSLP
jgi:hypothetical protein